MRFNSAVKVFCLESSVFRRKIIRELSLRIFKEKACVIFICSNYIINRSASGEPEE